jgi:peptide/nickel transport system ATP-binding protein
VSRTETTADPVLKADNLVKDFGRHGRRGAVHAVDDVSLSLYAGRVTALIGESGSGKSTISRLLALLEWPSSGKVWLGDTLVVSGGESPRRRSRLLRQHSANVQLVFQDPFSSLNENHTVGYHLERPLRIHKAKLGRDEDYRRRALTLLERVNLEPSSSYIDRYPHELSGGQRQRVAIARSLASEPSVLLADEPVSMLDVSVRLGILSLLDDIRRDQNSAILYITHDLASAGYFANDAIVMYAGSLVEGGAATDVIQRPAHPYTQLLRRAAPDPDTPRSAPLGDVGEPPSLAAPPPGCRFHPRCPHAAPLCRTERPPATNLGEGHWAACWLYSDRHPDHALANGASDPGLLGGPIPSKG